MEKITTGARLRELMSARKLRQVDLLNLTEPYCKKYGVRIQKSDISAYVNDKYLPSQDRLYILCLALNVSEAWLMGFDVPIERPERPEPETLTQKDERTDQVIRLYSQLDAAHQETLLNVLQGLLADQAVRPGGKD